MSLSKYQNENLNIIDKNPDYTKINCKTDTFEKACRNTSINKIEDKDYYSNKSFLSNNNTTIKANINNGVYSPFVIKKTPEENSFSTNFILKLNFELIQKKRNNSLIIENNLNTPINFNNTNLNKTSIFSNEFVNYENIEQNTILAEKNFSFFDIISKEHKKYDFSRNTDFSKDSSAKTIKSFFSPETQLNITSNNNNKDINNHTLLKSTKFYTPSPNNFIKYRRLSDRFIPLNKGINLLEKFELTKNCNEAWDKKSNFSLLDNSFGELNLSDSSYANLNNLNNSNNYNNNNLMNNTNTNNNHFGSNINIMNNSTNNSNNGNNNDINDNFFANSSNQNIQKQYYSKLLKSNIFTFNNENNSHATSSNNKGPIIDKSFFNQKSQTNHNLISNSNNSINSNNINLNMINNNINNINTTNNNELIYEDNHNANLSFSEISNGKIKSKLFEFKSEKFHKNKNIFANEFNIINSLNPNKTNLKDFSLSQKYGFSDNNINNENNNSNKKISGKPFRILEAPGLSDDFYLNLIDWSSQNNIAVGLEHQVFLWCCKKTKAYKLFSYEELSRDNRNKIVTSVIWNPDGTELAVGNNSGQTEIWDVNKRSIVRTFNGHSDRVGVVAWKNNIISTGSKDSSIISHDYRSQSLITKHLCHKQEVCGLKWSFDGTHLASGGNDNKLCVWNLNSKIPLLKSTAHSAAVKAIAWSPFNHNLLASGGGTADKCIRFWNMNNYSNSHCFDTGSQVCNLVFSKNSNELISTHGYSLNQINLWKLPQMNKIATLTGHSFRVLYLGISPDGQNIVTGAGDESLRFWNVFPQGKFSNEQSSLFLSNLEVR